MQLHFFFFNSSLLWVCIHLSLAATKMATMVNSGHITQIPLHLLEGLSADISQLPQLPYPRSHSFLLVTQTQWLMDVGMKRLGYLSPQDVSNGATLVQEVTMGQLKLLLLPLPILLPSYLPQDGFPRTHLMKVLLSKICFSLLPGETELRQRLSLCQCLTTLVTHREGKDLPLAQKCAKFQV